MGPTENSGNFHFIRIYVTLAKSEIALSLKPKYSSKRIFHKKTMNFHILCEYCTLFFPNQMITQKMPGLISIN